MTSTRTLCLLVLTFALPVPACGDLSDIPIRVTDTRYRPDGTLMVFTQAGIKVYDGDLATETASISVVESDFASSVDLARDGQVASVIHDYGLDYSTNPPKRIKDSEVWLYGIPGGAMVGKVELKNFEGAVTLSPAVDFIFATPTSSNGPDDTKSVLQNALYRVSDSAQLWTFGELDLYHQLNVSMTYYCGALDTVFRPRPVFLPDGQTVLVPVMEYVVAVDIATGAARIFANARACVAWMDLLPDGSLLVLRGLAPFLPGTSTDAPADEAQDSSLVVFAADGTALREIPRFGDYSTQASIYGGSTQVACTPAGDRCALAVEQPRFVSDPTTGAVTQPTSGSVLIFGSDGTLQLSLPMDGTPGTMSFSPDGSRLAMEIQVAEKSCARVYRVSDGVILAQRNYTAGVF